ncbi:MAG: low molecular weight protein arginine phosphatase, partial [Firmicutes bacterium]|nr:low molecular weight protein arginine phosphatase [Bacillota bacterium]
MGKEKKMLLFLCTGNTCRSPLAQVLAEALLQEAALSEWVVASAGLSALAGMSASSHALTVAHTLGLDLSAHQSRPLTAALAQRADKILVMTSAHKEVLLQHFPQFASKVSTLKESCASMGDVQDPYGGSVAVYMDTA